MTLFNLLAKDGGINITTTIIMCVLIVGIIGLFAWKTIANKKQQTGNSTNNNTKSDGGILDSTNTNYFRYQKDKQIVIQRNAEQQKIFDEYFVVKNYVVKKTPILIACIIAIVLGAIFCLVYFTNNDKQAFFIIGIILAIIGVILEIVYKKTIKIIPKKVMTDKEYEDLVDKKIKAFDVVTLGLAKLNLDAEQVKEIEPIILRNKVITDTSLTVFNDKDKSLHSSTQYVFVLYFTDEQLLVYKIQFDMCCNLLHEWTSEFFYKDICDLSTHCENNVLTLGKSQIEYSTLAVDIISTNSQIGFVMDELNMDNQSIQAMRQKLRDKKYA